MEESNANDVEAHLCDEATRARVLRFVSNIPRWGFWESIQLRFLGVDLIDWFAVYVY